MPGPQTRGLFHLCKSVCLFVVQILAHLCAVEIWVCLSKNKKKVFLRSNSNSQFSNKLFFDVETLGAYRLDTNNVDMKALNNSSKSV